MSKRGINGPRWKEDEKNYLIENAGRLSLKTIAEKLGRPYNGVVAKADKLGVASGRMCTSLYTTNQFAKLIGVAATTILHWTELGLKCKLKSYRTSFQYKMIDIKDFYRWGEQHQELIDTRKFKMPNFGNEPQWLIDKRKIDRSLPTKHNKIWAEIEKNKLIALYNSGASREVMAKTLGRSLSGVQRKIDRLKALGYLPIEKKGEFYTEIEESKLLRYKSQGLTNRQIGEKLGGRDKHSISHKYNELKAKGLVI